MNRSILASLSLLALAACGGTVSAGAPSAAPAQRAVAIHVASNATLGAYLTTASGRTLYYFTPERDAHDTGPQVACTGSCVRLWPPLLAPTGLLSTEEALPGTLKTILRPDGGRQVTYEDWPLYTFSGDARAGEVNGEGIMGEWFVAVTGLTEDQAAPTPTPVAAAAAAPPEAPPAAAPRYGSGPAATPRPVATSCIPGANGGDHDGDNNGLPSDGDGCQ